MSDTNWGPQDASSSALGSDLPLFVSRSMSAFYIDLFGPLHWISKCQKVTAASSAEAEIYATDECVKFLLELVQILDFLDVKHIFMLDTNIIYNDNRACVQWSKRAMTKGLRHIQMHEIGFVRTLLQTLFLFIISMENSILLTFLPRKYGILHILWSCATYSCVLDYQSDSFFWDLLLSPVDCQVCYWVLLVFAFLEYLPVLVFKGGVSIISNMVTVTLLVS